MVFDSEWLSDFENETDLEEESIIVDNEEEEAIIFPMLYNEFFS